MGFLIHRHVPSATALSTQVIQQQFAIEFEDETQPLYPTQVFNWLAKNGLPATPHSQRSWAWVTIALKANHKIFPIIELINQIENVLSHLYKLLLNVMMNKLSLSQMPKT